MKKRMLSLFIAIVMLMGMMPAAGLAQAGEERYTVTLEETVNGTVAFKDGYTSPAAPNEWFYLDITPDEGYELENVTVVGDSGDEAYFDYSDNSILMPAENVTVSATFTEKTGYFDLTCNVYSGETQLFNDAIIKDGDVLTLEVLGPDGEAFDRLLYIMWTDAEGKMLASSTDTYTVDVSKISGNKLCVDACHPVQGVTLFQMQFSTVGYTVTLEDAEHGTVAFKDGYTNPAAPDSWVYLNVTPDEGYVLDTVIVTGNDSSDKYDFDYSDNSFQMPKENVTVSATFVAKEDLSVTVTVTNQNGETLSDGGTVNVGDRLTVSVTGLNGRWIDYFIDDAYSNSGTEYTVTFEGETLTIYVYVNLEDYRTSFIENAVAAIRLNIAGSEEFDLTFKVYRNETEVKNTVVVANGDVLTLQVLDADGEDFTGSLDIDWCDSDNDDTLLADDVYTYTVDSSKLSGDGLYVAVYTPTGNGLFSMNFSTVGYTVTLEETVNGTVAFKDGYTSPAAPDSWVYLNVTPDEGYELDAVTIMGDSGETYDLYYSDNSILMPYENVTVTVTFKAESSEPIVPAETLTVTRNGSEIARVSYVYAGDELVASFDDPNVTFRWYYLEEDNTETTLTNEAELTVTDEMLAYEYIYINVYDADGAFIDGFALIPREAYTVTLEEPENGAVAFKDGYTSPAAPASWVYLIFTPDEGYELDTVTITGDSGETYDFYDSAYSFLMPYENVTVHVEFVPKTHYIGMMLKAVDSAGNAIDGYFHALLNGSGISNSTEWFYRQMEAGEYSMVFDSVPSGYQVPDEVTLTISADGDVTTEAEHVRLISEDGEHVVIVVTLAQAEPVRVETKVQLKAVDANGNPIGEMLQGFANNVLLDTVTPTGGMWYVDEEYILSFTSGNVPTGYKALADVTFTVNADGSVTSSDVTVTQEGDVYFLMIVLEEDSPTPTYAVTIAPTTGGTVTADKAAASEGETVTLTITPNDGYELESLTVKQGDSDVPVSGTGHTCSFSMPAGNVTITATFKISVPTDCEFNMRLKLVDEENNTIDVSGHGLVGNGLIYTFQDAPRTLLVGSNTFRLFFVPDGYLRPEDAVLNVDASGNLTSGSSHVAIEKKDGVYYIVVTLEKEAATYTVTIDENIENGMVTADKTAYVKENDLVTLTVTPNDGYELEALTVKQGDSDVSVSGTDHTRTFSMPAGNVTITATFKISFPTVYEFNMQLKLVDEENKPIAGDFYGVAGSSYIYTSDAVVRTLLVGSNTLVLSGTPDGYVLPEDAVLNVDANGNLTSGSSHVAIEKKDDVYYIVVTLEKEAVFSASLSDDLGNQNLSAMDIGRTYIIHMVNAPAGYTAAFYPGDYPNGYLQLPYASPFTFTRAVYNECKEAFAQIGFSFNCFYAMVLDEDGNLIWADFLPINEPDSTYTVTVTTDGNGSASADPVSGATGTEVTLTATPSTGYRFKKWQVISGGVNVENNKFTIGTANVEVKAIFEQSGPAHTADITVIGQTGAAYTAVQAKLMPLGSMTAIHERSLSVVPGSAPQQFLYHETAPDGSYNLVITATDEETGKILTVTTLIDLLGHDDQHTVYLPSADRSSTVNDESGSGIIAGNMELIANAQKPAAPDGYLEVQLSIDEGYDDQTGVTDKFLIEQKADEDEKTIEKVLDIDLMLLQYDKDDDLIGKIALGDTNTQLIEIMIPVDTIGRRADGFAVYRVHNDVLQKLPYQGEWFEVNIAGGYITLHVKHFSSYAIAYGDSVPVPAPSLPQTGDDSNLCLWLVMCVLSMAGILLMRRKPLSR